MNPSIFARLAKYDETTGYFEAVAADETLDKSQEIFDYEKSKPHFVEWSTTIAKATDGQSVGNVRAMHGKVVAGKLTKLEFDDPTKAIRVAGMIIDQNEREKVAKGCYTGVSIGGSYVNKWNDPVVKGAQRYEAKPTEVSIVDLPCNPSAMFTVVKADKSEELRKFVKAASTQASAGDDSDDDDDQEGQRERDAKYRIKGKHSEAVERGKSHASASFDGDADENDAHAKAAHHYRAAAEHYAAGKEEAGDKEAVKGDELHDALKQADKAVRAQTLRKVAERKDVDPKEGKDKYGDVDFADEKNKKYPIDTAAHVRAAWNYINKPKNASKYSAEDVKTIKGKIIAAWKKKIDPDGPPSAKKSAPADAMQKLAQIDCVASVLVERSAAQPKVAAQLGKLAQFFGQPLQKGFWSVACLAEVLCNLESMVCQTEYEAASEGDESTIPAQLSEAAANLAQVLIAMAEEESDEAFEHGNASDDDDAGTLAAAAKATLKKFADRHQNIIAQLSKRATEAESKVEALQKRVTEEAPRLAKLDVALNRIKELEKSVSVRDALMIEAAEKIAKLTAEPQPIKAAQNAVALSKAEDQRAGSLPSVESKVFRKADGEIDQVRTALHKALSEPINER